MRRKRNLEKRKKLRCLGKACRSIPRGHLGDGRLFPTLLALGDRLKRFSRQQTILLQKPDSFKAFDSFLEKRKPAQSVSSPLTTIIESEGLPVEGTQGSSSNMTTKQSTSTKNNQEPVDGVVLAFNGVSSGTDQDAWSETQERALIQALKTFPKDINQRWERVAAAVPGKTVIRCRRKFALMKENFGSKKNAEQ